MVMASIFSHLVGKAPSDAAYQYFRNQAGFILNMTMAVGKDLWLAGTGWPRADGNTTGQNVSKPGHAKQYFNTIECQVLSGTGSGFFYEDWAPDASLQQNQQLSLIDMNGNALDGLDFSCSGFVPNKSILPWVPKVAGGQGTVFTP